jgi:hypothetical protein
MGSMDLAIGWPSGPFEPIGGTLDFTLQAKYDGVGRDVRSSPWGEVLVARN